MPSVWRRPDRMPAHPVPQVHPIDAARALHRPVMHGEHDAVALPSGTTSARDCMRGRCSVITNSPPVKSRPGSESRIASCSGKTCSP